MTLYSCCSAARMLVTSCLKILPSCLVTWTVIVIFICSILSDHSYVVMAQSTTQKPTTTEEPFLQSSMFIGIAAGVGGFLGFAILCCIVWKCCCGGKD